MLLSHAPISVDTQLSCSWTHLKPHTVTGDLLIVSVRSREYHRSTKSEKWVTRGSCPSFFFGRGQLLFVFTRVWRGPRCPLSHFSMDNGLPPSPPSLSLTLSTPLPRSVLDHWLTQYCLRLTAKGSRLRAKRLLTLAGAA